MKEHKKKIPRGQKKKLNLSNKEYLKTAGFGFPTRRKAIKRGTGAQKVSWRRKKT